MTDEVQLQPDWKNTDWYEHLIEDAKAIVVETSFSAKMALIEGYHKLGERVCQENDNFERAKIYGKDIVKSICEDMEKPRFIRTLYYAIQFYKQYNDLDKYLEDKDKTNFSWTQAIKTLQRPTVKDIPESSLKPEEKVIEGEQVEEKPQKPDKPHIEWAYINDKWQIMIEKDVIETIDWSKVKDNLLQYLEGLI